MTVTDEEIDLSQLFDFEIECGWYKSSDNECPIPARWSVTTTCCQEVNFLCNDHLIALKNKGKNISVDESFFCSHCGVKQPNVTEWIIVAPL